MWYAAEGLCLAVWHRMLLADVTPAGTNDVKGINIGEMPVPGSQSLFTFYLSTVAELGSLFSLRKEVLH